jgi:hypothetical protein
VAGCLQHGFDRVHWGPATSGGLGQVNVQITTPSNEDVSAEAVVREVSVGDGSAPRSVREVSLERP